MARNENENLDGLIIPDADHIEVTYVDKTGNECVERDAVAKISQLHNKEDNRLINNYYVKYGRGLIFDPYGMDMNKSNAYNFQFKKVDESIYNSYVDYLKTRREIFLTSARRAFTNRGY
jgi:hypothetical protein